MSIRSLPVLTAPQLRGDVRFDFHPQARERWDAGITNAAPASEEEATISILEPIGIDFWTGEGVTAKRIGAALRSIGERPVTVFVNSPGGDFFEGLAIYNLLREHPEKVTMQILGLAASAAATIAMAGDVIQVAKAGLMFIHNTQWFAAGDRHVMQQAAEDMEKFDEVGAGLLADRTGAKLAEVHQWMDRETFFTGEQAIDAGLADGLLPRDAARKPKNEIGETPAAYRLEALLERHGVPRSERRKAVREFIEVTPSADPDGTPGAAECDEGIAMLHAARMRFSLS